MTQSCKPCASAALQEGLRERLLRKCTDPFEGLEAVLQPWMASRDAATQERIEEEVQRMGAELAAQVALCPGGGEGPWRFVEHRLSLGFTLKKGHARLRTLIGGLEAELATQALAAALPGLAVAHAAAHDAPGTFIAEYRAFSGMLDGIDVRQEHVPLLQACAPVAWARAHQARLLDRRWIGQKFETLFGQEVGRPRGWLWRLAVDDLAAATLCAVAYGGEAHDPAYSRKVAISAGRYSVQLAALDGATLAQLAGGADLARVVRAVNPRAIKRARCEEAKRRRWEGQVTLFSLFPATLNGALDDVLLLWQRTPKAPPPSFGGLLLGGGAVAAAGAVLTWVVPADYPTVRRLVPAAVCAGAWATQVAAAASPLGAASAAAALAGALSSHALLVSLAAPRLAKADGSVRAWWRRVWPSWRSFLQGAVVGALVRGSALAAAATAGLWGSIRRRWS